jgi:hypothetical protein
VAPAAEADAGAESELPTAPSTTPTSAAQAASRDGSWSGAHWMAVLLLTAGAVVVAYYSVQWFKARNERRDYQPIVGMTQP